MKKSIALFSALVIAGSMTIGAAFGAQYKLPEDMDGQELDKATGNPAVVDGKPMWGFNQIWPDNPRDVANYVPMLWNGKNWYAKENSFGGQPGITCGAGTVNLSVRSGWQGAKNSRLASLNFIAPEAGKYTFSLKAKSALWSGSGEITFVVLKLDKANKKTVKVLSVQMPDKQEVPVALPSEQAVDLAAGDELAFLVTYPQMHMASGVTLTGIVVESK